MLPLTNSYTKHLYLRRSLYLEDISNDVLYPGVGSACFQHRAAQLASRTGLETLDDARGAPRLQRCAGAPLQRLLRVCFLFRSLHNHLRFAGPRSRAKILATSTHPGSAPCERFSSSTRNASLCVARALSRCGRLCASLVHRGPRRPGRRRRGEARSLHLTPEPFAWMWRRGRTRRVSDTVWTPERVRKCRLPEVPD